jgi:glucan phosphoethanolaminetransferase (alkaline phosphatase superfamily)
MRRAAALGTAAALLATLAHFAHGFSHAAHGVPLATWQWAYVLTVIFLAPVLAAVLLWTRFRRAGAWLLLLSMVGSLLFGLAFHFLVPGPDNVFGLQHGAWHAVFVTTAVLVALSEALGVAVGAWAVRELSRDSAGAAVVRPVAGPR